MHNFALIQALLMLDVLARRGEGGGGASGTKSV